MKNKSKLPIISTIVFVITMIINYGSMVGMFGNTQEEVSNMYRNFITPEPFTFSIWGVIYTLVLVFLIYQFYLLKKDKYDEQYLDRLNVLFILSSLFNMGWNVLWVKDIIGISTILILGFTIILGIINSRILSFNNKNYNVIIPTAFSIYFGWLTVATVTNVAAFLVKIDWNMFGLQEHLWACLTYILVALLAGFIIFKIKNPLFNLPIIWAFVGIHQMIMNNPPKPEVHWGMPYVIYAVFIALIIESIVVFKKNNWKILPENK